MDKLLDGTATKLSNIRNASEADQLEKHPFGIQRLLMDEQDTNPDDGHPNPDEGRLLGFQPYHLDPSASQSLTLAVTTTATSTSAVTTAATSAATMEDKVQAATTKDADQAEVVEDTKDADEAEVVEDTKDAEDTERAATAEDSDNSQSSIEDIVASDGDEEWTPNMEGKKSRGKKGRLQPVDESSDSDSVTEDNFRKHLKEKSTPDEKHRKEAVNEDPLQLNDNLNISESERIRTEIEACEDLCSGKCQNFDETRTELCATGWCEHKTAAQKRALDLRTIYNNRSATLQQILDDRRYGGITAVLF
jgi:hypothetical protein